jgi:hypothetical protein
MRLHRFKLKQRMKTVKIIKPHRHKSNDWKVGDTPTVKDSLAAQLIKDKVAVDTAQADSERFKPTEADDKE